MSIPLPLHHIPGLPHQTTTSCAATRSRIVPSNRRYPVKEVIDATRRFLDRTGRIPTIEYCLLDGVNDSDAQATLWQRWLEASELQAK